MAHDRCAQRKSVVRFIAPALLGHRMQLCTRSQRLHTQPAFGVGCASTLARSPACAPTTCSVRTPTHPLVLIGLRRTEDNKNTHHYASRPHRAGFRSRRRAHPRHSHHSTQSGCPPMRRPLGTRGHGQHATIAAAHTAHHRKRRTLRPPVNRAHVRGRRVAAALRNATLLPSSLLSAAASSSTSAPLRLVARRDLRQQPAWVRGALLGRAGTTPGHCLRARRHRSLKSLSRLSR
jgi:hypothetical protein